VGDVDRRHVQVALDALDLRAHLDPELGVEVREGLVHQERLRFPHDRTAHRHTLALASGKRARLLLQHLREAERLRGAFHATCDLGLVDPAYLQRERHVVVGAHVRVERVVLEDHRNVAILRRQRVHDITTDPNGSVGDRLQPSDHPKRRRLATARRTNEDDKLPVADREVELRDRPRPVLVNLGQLVELNLGHTPPPFGQALTAPTSSPRDIRRSSATARTITGAIMIMIRTDMYHHCGPRVAF
jgi:hypothetical protein